MQALNLVPAEVCLAAPVGPAPAPAEEGSTILHEAKWLPLGIASRSWPGRVARSCMLERILRVPRDPPTEGADESSAVLSFFTRRNVTSVWEARSRAPRWVRGRPYRAKTDDDPRRQERGGSCSAAGWRPPGATHPRLTCQCRSEALLGS